MVALGGVPWEEGLGFSNPDNLAFEPAGNLWMVTDRPGAASLDGFGKPSGVPAKPPRPGVVAIRVSTTNTYSVEAAQLNMLS